MIPCRFEPFGLDTSFQRVFPFKQIDRHMTDDTEIFRKPVDITGGDILSGFDTTVFSIDCFAKVGGAIGGIFEEQGYIFMEVFLVVFDLDDVIGFFVDDGAGDFF